MSSLEIDTSIPDKLLPQDNSLWRIVKGHQLKHSSERLALIFDQFEELFSYPDQQVFAFKKAVAELLRGQIPRRYEQMLDISQSRNQGLFSMIEEQQLYEALNVRILFIIRSDKMHLLDQLSDYLPTVLKNNHELKALRIKGATEAIIMPPSLDGEEFYSPKFSYNDPAKNKILDFLVFLLLIQNHVHPHQIYRASPCHIRCCLSRIAQPQVVIAAEALGFLEILPRTFSVAELE